MRRRAGRVDQQRLGRAADAGAAQLGVEHDGARHGEIGGGIDIDMAVAVEMGEDRHARLALDARDQALAAARHDHVDAAVEARQHLADGGAVARRHELDRVAGQAGRAQALRAGRRGWRGEVRKLSEPPRRIAALPLFRHSAPASAVTLGRLSKITRDDAERRRARARSAGRWAASIAPGRGRPDRAGRRRSATRIGDRRRARAASSSSRSMKAAAWPAALRLGEILRIGGEDRRRHALRSAAAMASSAASRCCAGASATRARGRAGARGRDRAISRRRASTLVIAG